MRFWRTVFRMGVPFGIGMAAVNVWMHGWPGGAIQGAAAGLLFGLFIGGFEARLRRRMRVPGDVLEGERILHQGPGNHPRTSRWWGGWLVLTEKALLWRSSRGRSWNQALRIPLDQIRSAAPRPVFGVAAYAMIVTTVAGDEERFLVDSPEDWGRAIEAARGSGSV